MVASEQTLTGVGVAARKPVRRPPSKFLQRVGDLAMGLAPTLGHARTLCFAQWGEDHQLAFSLAPRKQGVYVDVGAYHPWKGSNTYKLYLRGWSGLTIEPNPAFNRDFQRMRSRDRHVNLGVSATPGTLTYYEFGDPKLNTFSSELSQEHQSKNRPLLRTRAIDCRPLQAVIDEYLPGSEIDLISVDCEGFDLIALQTLDFSKVRPTAILVEDFDAFRCLGRPGISETTKFLTRLDYRLIGQSLFSSLYVDMVAMKLRRARAFELERAQFRPE